MKRQAWNIMNVMGQMMILLMIAWLKLFDLFLFDKIKSVNMVKLTSVSLALCTIPLAAWWMRWKADARAPIPCCTQRKQTLQLKWSHSWGEQVCIPYQRGSPRFLRNFSSLPQPAGYDCTFSRADTLLTKIPTSNQRPRPSDPCSLPILSKCPTFPRPTALTYMSGLWEFLYQLPQVQFAGF